MLGGSAFYNQDRNPERKLQNRRVCVQRKNSKIGGSEIFKIFILVQDRRFAFSARILKSDVPSSFESNRSI